jgi:hypothetical protein
MRPIITKPRMVYKNGPSSEKFNFYANQFLMTIVRLAQTLNAQALAADEDLNKMVDDHALYSPNEYHQYGTTVDATPVASSEPLSFNLNGDIVMVSDIYQNNNSYIKAKEKAKFILRRLG